MNQKNFDYLNNQIKFSGFGENHYTALKENLQKPVLEPSFTLFHQQKFGNDEVVASLQFKKSADTDAYFFNRFGLILKNESNPDPLKQSFNTSDNITLKEGYNLMNARSVQKEVSPKEGEKFKQWIWLDFKITDKNGNHDVRKLKASDYDLETLLSKHPIKELTNDIQKSRLLNSLEKGNRQSATFAHQGNEQKIFIEAAPQFRTVNFYDSSMKRVNVQALYENPAVTQTQKQEEKSLTQKQDKPGSDEESDPGRRSQKNTKKKGQSIS